jgi:hypothetical protein
MFVAATNEVATGWSACLMVSDQTVGSLAGCALLLIIRRLGGTACCG